MPVLFSFSSSTQGRLDAATAQLFINGVRAVVGAPISTGDIITITTVPGRIFTDTGNSFSFGAAGIKYFVLNVDKTVGTLDLTGEINSVTANAFTTILDPTVLFTYIQLYVSRSIAANVTMFKNNVAAVMGDVFRAGDVMKLTTIPTLQFKNQSSYLTINNATFTYFALNSDSSEGVITLSGTLLATEYKVVTETRTIVTPPDNPPVFTVTQTILDKLSAANSKMFKNGSQVSLNATMKDGDVITVTPNSGFILTRSEVYLTSSTAPNGIFSVNLEGTSATYTLSNSDIFNGFFVSTSAVVVETPILVITNSHLQKLNNSFVNMFKNNVIVVLGTEFKIGDVIKVSPNTSSQILADTWIDFLDGFGGEERIYLNQDVDKKNATYTFESDKVVSSFTFKTAFGPTYYLITQNDLNEFIAAQAKLFISGVPATVGAKVVTGDVLLATANSGRVFTNNSVWYQTSGGSVVYFDQNEDFTQATNTVSQQISGMFTVSTVLAPSPDVQGLNNVYKVTQNQLKSITRERFKVNQQGQVVDYGDYIIGLIELPFKTDLAYDVGSQDVQLGPKKTDISAILLDRDNIRLNLGVIHVPSVKNNFLDYKNTTALIHLPYCEPINIDMEYVIDQDVTIDYIINIYDGTATINITSSKTDEIVITQNIDMGIVVPFANVDSFPTKNDPRSIKLGADNGVKTAFIEILRNESILENGFFTIPVVDETTLSTYNGFAQVEQINLKSKATSFEKDLIISQLRDGVIIK